MSKYITVLTHLSYYDLDTALSDLIKQNIIKPDFNQLCINTTPHEINNPYFGAGSLIYDWGNATKTVDEYGKEHFYLPKRDNPPEEGDFTHICSQFQNTLFEDAINELKKYYNLGRVRLINQKPKTCLSWHTDTTKRIHYPIRTQKGAFMIIEDELFHLEKNVWVYTNTLVEHTSLNSSYLSRIHLVANVLKEK